LDAGIGGKEGATTGIEGGVIFENGDGGLDSIDGRATMGKDSPTGFERGTDTGLMSLSGIGWDGPSASMDEQNRGTGESVFHRTIVRHFAGKRGRATKR
jgi:hypothetical protein